MSGDDRCSHGVGDLVHRHVPQGWPPSLPDPGTKATRVLLASQGSSRAALTQLYTSSGKAVSETLLFAYLKPDEKSDTLKSFAGLFFSVIVVVKFLVCHN